MASRYKLEVDATIENLKQVIDFVNEPLAQTSCPLKVQMQMELAVEEIFVNIANYAYAPGKGAATILLELQEESFLMTITFIDHGVKYNPLEKEDPDVNLSAAERPIGGLGIFLTKEIMDHVSYEYKNGQNFLTLTKKLKG